ncbi:FecR family protein [Halomonas sp. SpR8]|uniref:FecR family protein n=1 Tax=Halomonas sp. SpR8 TaxID=3050463 RepID=UPI0027E5A839|nr:FecR family protein [Halomonas sp. SpR8]MDQ7728861.1 FecR family protein [Halomonas sp. SpR8]
MTIPHRSNTQPLHTPLLDDNIVDEAIGWYLRLKDSSATPHDRQAFETWLSRDPRHQLAYQKAKQLWQEIDAPARLFALQRAPQTTPKRLPKQPRWGWALAVTCLLGMLLSFELWREPAHLDHLMADTTTAPGQTQHLQLADGSSLLLDGNSALDIDLNETQRGLTLRRGRLWVDAAKDPQRPLIVTAGEASVRVIGTHFSVMRSGDRVTVTVAEGQVVVSDSLDHQAMLVGGQQIALQDGALGPVSPMEIPLARAWKEGRIIFDDAEIGEVVAQLERMLPGRVLLDTQAFSELRLSGSFHANQPAALLETLTDVVGITVHHLPGNLLWLRPTHTR